MSVEKINLKTLERFHFVWHMLDGRINKTKILDFCRALSILAQDKIHR